MIELKITPEMVSSARAEAQELGSLRNSITSGEGNVAGFIGELLVADFYGATRVSGNRNYDMTVGDLRVDVKTKRRTVEPAPHYFATVAAYNTKQECDYYVFTSVLTTLDFGWICGWLSKDEFFEKAQFFRKDDPDPSGQFGWTFTADCYNVPLSELKDKP